MTKEDWQNLDNTILRTRLLYQRMKTLWVEYTCPHCGEELIGCNPSECPGEQT